MAIQAKITTIQGITLETAYINIQNPQIQKVVTEHEVNPATETVNTFKITGNACVYISKEAYDTGKIPIEGFSVISDLNLDINPYTQAYAQLALNERLENIVEA